MRPILNRGQQAVVEAAVNWYHNSSEQVFQYTGNPGTGKSVVLNEIIHRLQLPLDRVAPMSFIGAAAIVMRLKGLYNAKTIHSWLYHPVEDVVLDPDGNPVMNEYFNRPITDTEFIPKPLTNVDLIVIDEAYCVPKWMKKDIEDKGIKIIACGDGDQLPPVDGEPAYLTSGHIMRLEEIMRQKQNSGIIYLSQRAKLGLPIHCGFYRDALVIEDDQVTDDMIMNSNMVLCGKNSTREMLNSRIRQSLGFNTEIPMYGERVMCRKNNWKLEVDGISLANGLVGNVVNQPDVGSFDGYTFNIDFKPDLLNNAFKDLKCNYKYFIANSEQRRWIKKDKYAKGEHFEFAYACTTHSAQGSEYPYGMYFEEYLSPDINNKLNFVGITRFSQGVIYVKHKKKYY